VAVKKRTFEATEHPEGSPQRIALNLDPLTSDEAPTFPWLAIPERAAPMKFKTRAAAEGYHEWHDRGGTKRGRG
jgi:hypothetical protein